MVMVVMVHTVHAYTLAVMLITVLFELGDRLLQQCQIFLLFFVVDYCRGRRCALVDDGSGLDEFGWAGRRHRR